MFITAPLSKLSIASNVASFVALKLPTTPVALSPTLLTLTVWDKSKSVTLNVPLVFKVVFDSVKLALALLLIIGVSFVATTLIVTVDAILSSSPSFATMLNTLFVVVVGSSELLLYLITSSKDSACAKLIFPLAFSKVKELTLPLTVAVILYATSLTVIFAIAFPFVKLRGITVPSTIKCSFAPSKIDAVGIDIFKLCKSCVESVSPNDVPAVLNETSFAVVSAPSISVNVAVVFIFEIVAKLFLVIITCDAAMFEFPAISFTIALAKSKVILPVPGLGVTSTLKCLSSIWMIFEIVAFTAFISSKVKFLTFSLNTISALNGVVPA